MRALFVLAVAAVAAAGMPPATLAQTPTVSVFFDEGLTRMDKDCPLGGGVDSAYVVARDFNIFIAGIEYAINYPPSMVWMADADLPPVTLGTTPTGIAEAWELTLNGYGPVVVAKIKFMWNCNTCAVTDDPLIVVPFPLSGFVRAVAFPQYTMVDGVGMTSLVCPTVPVDETTWGRIKALYGD